MEARSQLKQLAIGEQVSEAIKCDETSGARITICAFTLVFQQGVSTIGEVSMLVSSESN